MSQKQVARYLFGGGVLGVSATVVFGASALFPDPADAKALEDLSAITPDSSTVETFKGSVEEADVWGYVQVQIQVEDSAITGIKLLKFPNQSGESAEINAGALPDLVAAALQSQSADIAGVSGATYTSTAFKNSLQAALMEAGL
ncbi:MAG: hypothetical protein RL038_491 [Actinomycetota bacterium]